MAYMTNTFQPTEQYEFVNTFLNILYGKLPSYCYYDSDDELTNFWNNLTDTDYSIIEEYLIGNLFINTNNKKKSKDNVLNFFKSIL
jgi:hypothetical protein